MVLKAQLGFWNWKSSVSEVWAEAQAEKWESSQEPGGTAAVDLAPRTAPGFSVSWSNSPLGCEIPPGFIHRFGLFDGRTDAGRSGW